MIVALAIATGGGVLRAAHAQGTPTNLLVNGSMESPYYAEGAPTRTVPHGWHLWVGSGAPNAVPYKEKPQVRDGDVSWNIAQSGSAFTVAGYQQVPNVTPGDTLRLTAYGWVFACDDPVGLCTIAQPPYRRSDAAAGALLRVGIDTAGGTDPMAPGIHWSAAVAPYDQWSELSVSAEAQSDTVTVFLYGTQTRGLAINALYWDQVTLVVGSEATPVPNSVPYVLPQGVRPDGSIVHTIQAGDTLSSIAYAYADYGVTVASIADLNEGIRPNTRFLTPGDELVILPPGSVDPATGEMIAETPTPTITPLPVATLTPSATRTATPFASPTGVQPSPTPAISSATPVTATAADTPTPTAEPVITGEPSLTVVPVFTPTQTAPPPGLMPAVGTLCLSVFRDDNLNGQRDDGEITLTGVMVKLSGSAGSEQVAIESAADPLCVDRAAGTYSVQITPPGGFGLTTAGSLLVELASGRRYVVTAGAAPGFSPPTPPDNAASSAAVPTSPVLETGAVAPLIEVNAGTPASDSQTWLDRLYDASGVIVLVAAAVIAVGSVLALGLLRRQ